MDITDKQLARFWEKVAVKGYDECWIWTAHILQTSGYGQGRIGKKRYLAHRLSWMIDNKKDIPADMLVLHSCNNAKCVNPNHLRLGTPSENMQDRIAAGHVTEKYLTKEQVLEIYNSNEDWSVLMEKYDRSVGCIANIKYGTRWNKITNHRKVNIMKKTGKTLKNPEKAGLTNIRVSVSNALAKRISDLILAEERNGHTHNVSSIVRKLLIAGLEANGMSEKK